MSVPLFCVLAILAQSVDREIDVAGATRSYVLHAGKDAKKPAPLVVSLHGTGANGKTQEALCGLSPLADKHGFVAVYPTRPRACGSSGRRRTSRS